MMRRPTGQQVNRSLDGMPAQFGQHGVRDEDNMRRELGAMLRQQRAIVARMSGACRESA
jgi:hypothetical protein